MGWTECICCEKFQCDFVAQTFASTELLRPVFHRVYYRNETFPIALEHYKTLQNMSLGVLWGGSGVVILRNYETTSWHELLH
jgi:hypothetical protein